MTERSPGDESDAANSAQELSAEHSEINSIAATAAERRIAWLTLGIGAMAAAILALRQQREWATGIAIGAALAWLNFRWLRRGLDALAGAAAAQSGAAKARVPLWVWALLLLRYGLIGMAVYVIFAYLHVPIVSTVVGLCALGAATIAESVYEIVHPVK